MDRINEIANNPGFIIDEFSKNKLYWLMRELIQRNSVNRNCGLVTKNARPIRPSTEKQKNSDHIFVYTIYYI